MKEWPSSKTFGLENMSREQEAQAVPLTYTDFER